jgi:hypothetical protein
MDVECQRQEVLADLQALLVLVVLRCLGLVLAGSSARSRPPVSTLFRPCSTQRWRR